MSNAKAALLAFAIAVVANLAAVALINNVRSVRNVTGGV